MGKQECNTHTEFPAFIPHVLQYFFVCFIISQFVNINHLWHNEKIKYWETFNIQKRRITAKSQLINPRKSLICWISWDGIRDRNNTS